MASEWGSEWAKWGEGWGVCGKMQCGDLEIKVYQKGPPGGPGFWLGLEDPRRWLLDMKSATNYHSIYSGY